MSRIDRIFPAQIPHPVHLVNPVFGLVIAPSQSEVLVFDEMRRIDRETIYIMVFFC
jgi:hypothetical protein